MDLIPLSKINWLGKFPGEPVAKILCSQCRGPAFDSGQGTGSHMPQLRPAQPNKYIKIFKKISLLAMDVWVYFWTLRSVLLIIEFSLNSVLLFILTPASYCFDYCNFVVNYEIRKCLSFNLFKSLLFSFPVFMDFPIFFYCLFLVSFLWLKKIICLISIYLESIETLP